ncbi:MAG: hypothetical protein FJ215_11930 [Ignavibacteria bacterium]|nr:hypothetical protein [Ignavibacteria bacterium]
MGAVLGAVFSYTDRILLPSRKRRDQNDKGLGTRFKKGHVILNADDVSRHEESARLRTQDGPDLQIASPDLPFDFAQGHVGTRDDNGKEMSLRVPLHFKRNEVICST